MNSILKIYQEGRRLESECLLIIKKSNSQTEAQSLIHVLLTSPPFLKFVEDIRSLKSSQDFTLQKIAETGERFHTPWTFRQFLDILVPLERWLQKQVTDADWLHDSPDRSFTEVSKHPRFPLAVVLDHFRSAFNVGSILRTADAFAFEQVILTGYSPLPDSAAVHKTALGAELSTPWSHIEHVDEAMDQLQQKHFTLVALETTPQAQSLDGIDLPDRMAIILGNERFGLNTTTLKKVDHVIKIPMFGIKNSLNVATAFAILAFEWHRQKK